MSVNGRALSKMLTAGVIFPAVEQIASPAVTGICLRSENLKLYVNYVPCNPLAWIKLSLGKWDSFPALLVPTPICPYPVKIS